jgi:hypothetical protein
MRNESLDHLRVIWAMVLLLIFVLIGVWDIAVSYFHAEDYTVSNIMRVWSKQYPAIPLAIGYLLGHIFG